MLACARVWQAVNVYLVSRRVHRSDETAPLLTDSLDAAAEDDEVVLVPPPRAESRVLPAGSGSLSGDLQLHVASLGGWVVFGLHLLRLLACLSLVGLTLWAIVIDAEDSADPEDDGNVGVLKKGHRHGGRKKGRKGERRREAFGREEIVEILQCCFFVRSCALLQAPRWRLTSSLATLQIYCAMLALVTAILPRLRLLKTHLTVLLLAAFLLAAYRNLLPLVLGRKPLDIILHHLKGIHDPLWDTLVWLRVGLLGLAGVILPLILLLRCASDALKRELSTSRGS